MCQIHTSTWKALSQQGAELIVSDIHDQAVEEREREIMRRKGQTGLDCPNGAMAICYDYMSEERCMCVQPTAAGGGSGAEKLGVPN